MYQHVKQQTNREIKGISHKGANLQYHIQVPQVLHLAVLEVPDYLLIVKAERSTVHLHVTTGYNLWNGITS